MELAGVLCTGPRSMMTPTASAAGSCGKSSVAVNTSLTAIKPGVVASLVISNISWTHSRNSLGQRPLTTKPANDRSWCWNGESRMSDMALPTSRVMLGRA